MPTVTEWGTAIWTSLTNALAMLFAFIPKLLGFLVILLVGWIVASLLEKGITMLLRKAGFDRISERIGLTRFEQRMNMHMDPAALLGKIAFWFILLIFMVPAFDALDLSSVSTLLGQLVAYIPNVFVAIVILFLGTLFATFVGNIVRGATATANVGNPNVFAKVAQYAIIGFVAIIALTQLQIAPALMQTLFTAIVGALALAFGLAFGLGGREAAQRWLARGENELTTATAQYRSQRMIEQAHNTVSQMNTTQSPTSQPTPPQPATNQTFDSAPTMKTDPYRQQEVRHNEREYAQAHYAEQTPPQQTTYTQKPYQEDEPTQRFRP